MQNPNRNESDDEQIVSQNSYESDCLSEIIGGDEYQTPYVPFFNSNEETMQKEPKKQKHTDDMFNFTKN